jgi:hypothetical protein
MVPFRFIGEALGADVNWTPAVAGVSPLIAHFTLGAVQLDVPVGVGLYDNADDYMGTPVIVGGNTMVPVRYVSLMMGAEVEWERETETVIITFTPAGAPPAVGFVTPVPLPEVIPPEYLPVDEAPPVVAPPPAAGLIFNLADITAGLPDGPWSDDAIDEITGINTREAREASFSVVGTSLYVHNRTNDGGAAGLEIDIEGLELTPGVAYRVTVTGRINFDPEGQNARVGIRTLGGGALPSDGSGPGEFLFTTPPTGAYHTFNLYLDVDADHENVAIMTNWAVPTASFFIDTLTVGPR